MIPKGLIKEYSKTLSNLLRVIDIVAVTVAGYALYVLKQGHWQPPFLYLVALGIAAVLTPCIFSWSRVYDSLRGQSLWPYIQRVSQALLLTWLILGGLTFLTKTGDSFSRGWFLGWGLSALVLLLMSRACLLFILRWMRTKGLNERRVIIIGASSLGIQLAKTVQDALWTGFRIEAFFDDDGGLEPKSLLGIPVIQTPPNMSEYIKKANHAIDEIWIALPLKAEDRVKALLYDLRHHTISLRYALDIFGLDLLNHSITDLAGFPMLNLNASPMVGINRMIKAIEDRLLAFIILFAISPILILITIGVRLSSKGPILFKQQRHGWDGRIIKVYKFRTMYLHQDDQVHQATKWDDRITPFGRFLRRTSLDELPQFYNVLQGRMSIVGPRPHALAHNEFYKESIKAYMQRHKVKPGITGWAQINGWRGETEHIEKMQKRVEYDLYYIENWSLRLDLKIIFLTIFRGFISRNAY